MVQIFLVAYLVISLPAALLLWTALVAAKGGDENSPEVETLETARLFESKKESIDSYSS